MATYHLRVKNDSKPSGKKVSAKRHAEYILREEGKAHADYINREGAQSGRDDCVFKGSQIVSSREVSYRNGQKARLKNFSLRQPATRIKAIDATKKLSCLYPTN